jgi:hypothetical protein
MSKQQTAADEYENHQVHLAEQRYGILAGWVVVCGLALTIVLGISGPGSTVQERAEFAPWRRILTGRGRHARCRHRHRSET